MINRRQLVVGAAATAAVATALHSAPAAAAPPVPVVDPLEHLYRGHVFASTRIPGATWVERSINYSLDDEGIKAAKAEGFDLEAEVIAAVMAESVAEMEQAWLQKAREHAARAGSFDASKGNLDVMIQDGALSRMIRDAGEGTNVAIVSPTALTIMQSDVDTSHVFVRSEDTTTHFGMKQVGSIDHLKILCDQYARDDIPVLIGHVPEDPEERKGAIVRKDLAGFEFGSKPGLHDGWKRIEIEIPTRRYI